MRLRRRLHSGERRNGGTAVRGRPAGRRPSGLEPPIPPRVRPRITVTPSLGRRLPLLPLDPGHAPLDPGHASRPTNATPKGGYWLSTLKPGQVSAMLQVLDIGWVTR